MKFDYDLIEKIEATLYGRGVLYKVSGGVLFCWHTAPIGEWRQSTLSPANAIALQPIPPRQQPEYEYKKLEFDYAWMAVKGFEEFHAGISAIQLWIKAGDKYKEPDIYQVAGNYDNLYIRVEKPKPSREDIFNSWVDDGKTLECNSEDIATLQAELNKHYPPEGL